MSLKLSRPRNVPKRPCAADWRPVLADVRRAELLLDQQFWCFGRDITLPPKNALVEYGFRRHPKPRDRQDGSCYANRSRGGTVLALWGFGAYFAEQRGILVTRRSLVPLISDAALNPAGAWAPGDLDVRSAVAGDSSSALSLLARLCRWFAQYEDWILSVRPAGYDVRSLAGWSKIVVPRRDMAAAWRSLSAELEAQIAPATDGVRQQLESVA